MDEIDLKNLYGISLAADKVILEVYSNDFVVELKEDNSPVTIADRRSHNVIVEGLDLEYSNNPILSEKGRLFPFKNAENGINFG